MQIHAFALHTAQSVDCAGSAHPCFAECNLWIVQIRALCLTYICIHCYTWSTCCFRALHRLCEYLLYCTSVYTHLRDDCVFTYYYIYMYIRTCVYIYRERERETEREKERERKCMYVGVYSKLKTYKTWINKM